MGFSSNLSSYMWAIINPVGVLLVSKEGSIYFGCISGALTALVCEESVFV